ncbi:MAG: acyl-CoA thioesterase [Burkholderiales bacterium]|nr:acyl-CoA thioesterase [Burkholderiales bacterium]
MTKTHAFSVTVQFGDCNPAGEASLPTLCRWIDEAACAYFSACGVPPWRVLGRSHAIVCTRLIEYRFRLRKAPTHGDMVDVSTTLEDWQRDSVTLRHVVRRGDELLAEGTAARAFLTASAQEPERLVVMPTPESIMALCG